MEIYTHTFFINKEKRHRHTLTFIVVLFHVQIKLIKQ